MIKDITFISDTHCREHLIKNEDLIGGDFIIHSGDISGRGKDYEVFEFFRWFSSLTQYKHKILIAGNHDFLFQKDSDVARKLLDTYPDLIYLQDSLIELEGVKIYGTPWQPWFYDWAFNVVKEEERKEIFAKIPEGTDILVTHCPPHGILDQTKSGIKTGCRELFIRCMTIRPIINIFGHIHEAYGYKEFDGVHFINASVLDEQYLMKNKPVNCKVNLETREVQFV